MVGDPRWRARLARALLAWYRVHGRALVIRETHDPYAIWVGEVMSQQTQIGRVGQALPAFLARFPDVPALAAATTGEVVRAWGGLGYPRRAVALRDAARTMVERHAGRVPREVAALEALPGIGPYTARAVAATAFGTPVTALDVNARRVVGRLLDGTPLPAAPSPSAQTRVDALAPARDAGAWNHALMDLGAAVCRPLPDCASCPVRGWCAFADGVRGVAPASAARRPGMPFHATNRYVRGRVLAVLREAPVGSWATIEAETLAVAPERVERALRELADEGLVERQTGAGHPTAARLPIG